MMQTNLNNSLEFNPIYCIRIKLLKNGTSRSEYVEKEKPKEHLHPSSISPSFGVIEFKWTPTKHHFGAPKCKNLHFWSPNVETQHKYGDGSPFLLFNIHLFKTPFYPFIFWCPSISLTLFVPFYVKYNFHMIDPIFLKLVPYTDNTPIKRG